MPPVYDHPHGDRDRPREPQPRGTAQAHPYANRPDVNEFIREMVERHGFVEKELKTVFRRTTRQPEILKAIKPPTSPRARSWQSYRTNFINDRHIAEGLRFFEQHAGALARAEREYGVPQEIIVAIVGIETFYGKNMGKWRIVDALATLAFDYPPRADYFRSELEAYLLYTREADLDVRLSCARTDGSRASRSSMRRSWAPRRPHRCLPWGSSRRAPCPSSPLPGYCSARSRLQNPGRWAR